jgi:hypothetical protein
MFRLWILSRSRRCGSRIVDENRTLQAESRELT